MLVLVRHAKSLDQEQNRMSGQHNCPLAPSGWMQASELGMELANYEFDYIFSSDLERCVDTTRGVLRHNKHIEHTNIFYAEELRERSGGSIEGLTFTQIRRMIPPKKYKLWRRDYFEPPPMGESLKDVEDRVIPYLKEFVFPLVNDNKNVLVVTHSGVIRTIIRYIKASDESDIVKLEIENAMPYILYGHVRED